MKILHNMKNQKGFTLLEILLVVAAIGILAGIVILALNPGKQLGQTRNAQRWSDVNAILNGVYQYSIDHNGALPSNITTSATEICKTGGTCTGLINLSALTDTYLVSIPRDPQCTSTNGTCYNIAKTSGGRVTVNAPSAEQSVSISVTR